MNIFDRDNLMNMLKHNVVVVTFTKVNGDERVMKCTLLQNYLPNVASTNGVTIVQEAKLGDNNISVWDIDSNGWRSFRVSSVKSISVG